MSYLLLLFIHTSCHLLPPSHPPTLPVVPSVHTASSSSCVQYYTCPPSPPLPPSPPPPSPCSQVSHPLMMVGRTVTKSRLVNGGRSAVPMVLNFGGSESSSQGLLLTHLTTSTLAHLHHTHLYHTHIQHHIHMYTHSCTKRTQYVYVHTQTHSYADIVTLTHFTLPTHSHTHPHTPSLPPSPESGDPRNVERPGCQPQMAPHNNMICTTKVRKNHQHRM